jgi:hypothetical protein
MRKTLLFLFALSLIVFSSHAQTKPLDQLSIGGEFGLPTGQANRVYGSVIGASVKLEIPVSTSPFNFVITSGINDFLVKFDYTGLLANATYVPVEFGTKYYFSKIGYFEGDVGISTNINSNYSASRSAFIYAPIVGFSAPSSKHKGTVDIGLSYEGRVESGGTVSQVAVRVAYRFGLK